MAKNLELYLHIPFCVKKCAYCDFLSFSCDEQTQIDYADALIQEIKTYGLFMKEYTVSTVFIGGGTPSWLREDKMVEILEELKANFNILPEAEITMECNPGTMTLAKMVKYKRAGVNRLSIGLQSADNEELKLLGRIHTFEQFLKTYELAGCAGYTNINVDLISGIPYQTAEKFLKTLQKVVTLRPAHISAYSLIVEPGTPFYERYQEDMERQAAGELTRILPTEDEICRILELTQEYLQQNGYEQYEISNFAQPGYACKHNIGYWTRENYLGLGLGAASLIENVRYANTSDLYEYIRLAKKITWQTFFKAGANVLGTTLHSSVEPLSRKAQMEEFMFLGLRMKRGIVKTDFEKCFQVAIEGIYAGVLRNLQQEGLLEMYEGRIFLTKQGQDVSNYVLAKFLL